jgi:hypothetical protein
MVPFRTKDNFFYVIHDIVKHTTVIGNELLGKRVSFDQNTIIDVLLCQQKTAI